MSHFFLTLLIFTFSQAQEFSKSGEFKKILADNTIALDVRYSTTNNFTGRDVYGDFDECWLHKNAAAKLKRAAKALQEKHPGYKLLLFDCLRPRKIQKLLWNVVKDTDKRMYVADPSRGSVHNYGFAVDVSLLDAKGKELDMGTPYDSFSAKSQPAKEKEYLKSGELLETQISNRDILRSIMTSAGFKALKIEWWHFDAESLQILRRKYKIIE